MILIKDIYIDQHKDKSRLVFKIEADNVNKDVWFEVDKQYEQYLCTERSDAIIIGLLSYAMRNNHDITTKIPVTEDLLYNINKYLIPSLTKNDSSLYPCKIIAELKPAIKNIGNGVGTGLSCGIDSFHAIYNHLNPQYKQFKLTHLCINNVGAFNECYSDDGIEKVRKERYNMSIKVAKEIGLPLIVSDSNFQDVFEQNHLQTHTYSSMFAVFCLQKLWKIYLYGSSGYDFTSFGLENNSKKSSDLYELLSLNCFSNSSIRIYSEGAALNRLEKTKAIADMLLAHKYLHVCTSKATNCGICPKCRRTMLSLDAIGKLSLFDKVFDLKYYNKHRREYLFWLYKSHKHKDRMNEATYNLMKNEINWKIKMYPFLSYNRNFIFSIHNTDKRKIITILGVKIKIKNVRIKL